MSQPFIWGALPRAVNDATVIDDAIAIAVGAHNDDADSHLAPGQALTSHRAAVIIDHAAESVVNDKIRSGARTYLAIVGTEVGDDFATIEDAVDYAWTKGGGSIKVRKGYYTPIRNLNVRYGVDIYGEGPQETVIDLTSAPNTNLNFANIFGLTMPLLSYIYTDVDQDIGYPDMPVGVAVGALDGVYYDGISTYVGMDGYFFDYGSASGIGLEDWADVTAEYTDVFISPTLTASSSSKIVHINGWALCTGFEAFEGLQLVCDSGIVGTVNSYLGSGDFELVANANFDANKLLGISSQGPVGRMSIVQGVEFIATGSEYLFVCREAAGRLYVRDTAISGCSGLFDSDNNVNTQSAANVTIEDTEIVLGGATMRLDTSGATIRNSTIALNGSGLCEDIGGVNSAFENCMFTAPGFGYNKFGSIQAFTIFNACRFEDSLHGTIVCGDSNYYIRPDSTIMFANCYFGITGSTTTQFKGARISIVGCRMYHGGGTYGFESTSRQCIMTGCIVNGGTGTTPTNCLMTANLIV